MPEYKLTVGIECHVQFNTKTGLFAGGVKLDEDLKPNSVINHIDFGLPGALPVLNQQAVEKAIRAAFALSTKPSEYSTFDRKHYFYPDLPMGYQITQFNQPIILGGFIDISVDGQNKRINITRAHLEADAGKSVHPPNSDYSLIDLNRAGTPLLEIVSEPEMHSAAEAKAYARELWLLMRFAGVTNGNLYYGNTRFDVNISLSKDSSLGTRTEIKNLNSFRSVERAIEHESARQLKLLNSGEKIVQETRGWDDNEDKTYSMRVKENADDYRYMPDPDLPPIKLDKQFINKIKNSMPVLPNEWRARLAKHSLDLSVTDSLLQATAEYGTHNLNYLISLNKEDAKSVAIWLVNIELPYRAQENKITFSDSSRHKIYEQVLALVKDGKLNSNSTKGLILKLMAMNKLPKDIEELAKNNNLIQQSDPGKLKEIVAKVIKANPKAAGDVSGGELKAIGFLVGQVMKESGNQANPALVQELIKQKLGIN